MSKPLFNTAVDAATAARLFAKSTMDAAAGETSTAIGDIVSLPTESISLVSQRLAVQVALGPRRWVPGRYSRNSSGDQFQVQLYYSVTEANS